MNERKFYLVRDEFGKWQAQGAMTVSMGADLTCNPNPAAGVSSVPLASLSGTAAPAGTPAHAAAPAGAANLATGEWACYGTGGRILIGLGFRIVNAGSYTDLDHKNPGTYGLKD